MAAKLLVLVLAMCLAVAVATPTRRFGDDPPTAPTDAPTEAPSDAPTAAPTEAPTEASPASSSSPSTPPPSEIPYTKPTDIPDVVPRSCADRPDKNEYLMVPSPEDCRKFIVCDGPRETELECPSNLYFNYAKQYCDDPATSGCVDPEPTPTNAQVKAQIVICEDNL